MAAAPAAAVAPASPWDDAEPSCCNGAPCYSKKLKADLLPGTFVLLATRAKQTNGADVTTHGAGATSGVVARIIAGVSRSPSDVTVNIFKRLNELPRREGFLYQHPHVIQENHLRHLQEVVQTSELRIVDTNDIIDLCFVFTRSSLSDTSTLAFTCQGMTRAFLLRFRCNDGGAGRLLSEVPDGYCLPFPSSYQVCQIWLLLYYSSIESGCWFTHFFNLCCLLGRWYNYN